MNKNLKHTAMALGTLVFAFLVGTAVIGGSYMSSQNATALKGKSVNISVAPEKTEDASNIDPEVLAKAIAAAPEDAETVSVLDRNGKLTTQTVPKKIIVTGGVSSSNTVWQSLDGFTWSVLPSGAQFTGRMLHSTVYFKGKLYILGGYSTVTNADVNDVWSSSDGSNWTQITQNAPWSANHSIGAIVFKNKLWVLGGCFNQTSSIWNTSDGINWNQVVPNGNSPQVPVSCIDSAVVYNGSMWAYSDPNAGYGLWKSSDGINWTNLINNLPPNIVGNTGTNPKLTVFQNKLWWVGGDAYSTTDGISWTKKYSGGILPSAQHIVYSLNNVLHATGGYFVGSASDDVFSSQNGMTWNQSSSGLSGWHPVSTDAVKVPVTFGQTVCNPTAKPSIKVTSPNGGEIYSLGQQVTVKWTSCNLPPTALLEMNIHGGSVAIGFLAPNGTPNDGSETFTIDPSWSPANDFGLTVGVPFNNDFSNSALFISDSSDAPFTVN